MPAALLQARPDAPTRRASPTPALVPDPIFALIEAHRRANAALDAHDGENEDEYNALADAEIERFDRLGEIRDGSPDAILALLSYVADLQVNRGWDGPEFSGTISRLVPLAERALRAALQASSTPGEAAH